MELFFLLIGLFFLVTFFMPWVNHRRIGSARSEIDGLLSRIRDLENKLYGEGEVKSPKAQALAQPSKAIRDQSDGDQIEADKKAQEELTAKAREQEEIKAQEKAAQEKIKQTYKPETPAVSVPRVSKTDWAEKAQNTFEQNIATKLPVWIGSVSLIFAAFFLVKYSIEFGWLGPVARVSLGGLFAAGLLAAGQFISKRPELPNALRISQGLVGAGLVGLYVSLYAAINLYGLLPPVIGFAGMSVVTAMAVILSLKHGQPIAVFGLIGGLLTPALIGSEEPNVIALFTYLFLLFSGLFVVLIRKGWWALAIIALLGVFSWSAFWFLLAFAASDAFVLVLFAIALAGVVLAATGKRIADNSLKEEEKFSVHLLNAAAIGGGVLTIIWLSFEMTLGLFDWSMLGLLSLALVALAYFKPDVYQKPLLVKLGATLVLFLLWVNKVPLSDALAVIAGISVIYIGGSALMMRTVSDPRFWAGLQVITALSLYLISYNYLDLPLSLTQNQGAFGGMFWGFLALVLAGLAIYQAADIRRNFKADNVIREHLLAAYAFAASAFISLGLAIELPWAYVPLAIAGQVAATAWIYQRTNINSLKYIMYILTLVFAVMNYEQILLFISIILHSLSGEVPSAHFVSAYILDAPLVKLGIPALLMYLSLFVVLHQGDKKHKTDRKLIHALFGTANILALFTAYYLFRDVFHTGAGHIFSSETGFIERGIITMTLAGVGIGIMEFIRKNDIGFLKPWGMGIFRMAMIRFVYFDFFLHNPYWSDGQFVGNLPILNGVTFTYGVGLLAAVWAIRNRDMIAKADYLMKLYGGIALAAIFAVTSLNVRQYFHGGFLMQGGMSSAELYSYSVIWLLTGLAFLAAGIKFDNKAARMASIAFIALAVIKVFLFDAAELEGLYRVFSFLGLGISLIGLSYFYTRFVFDTPKKKDAADA